MVHTLGGNCTEASLSNDTISMLWLLSNVSAADINTLEAAYWSQISIVCDVCNWDASIDSIQCLADSVFRLTFRSAPSLVDSPIWNPTNYAYPSQLVGLDISFSGFGGEFDFTLLPNTMTALTLIGNQFSGSARATHCFVFPLV